eukprot:6470784-Amphidinium_carterae.1
MQRYHIDIAVKWAPGSPELSLSDHTIQQARCCHCCELDFKGLLCVHEVKQLTQMARVLEPAIFVFSKRIAHVTHDVSRRCDATLDERRIENVILQKERELRKVIQHPVIKLPLQFVGGTASCKAASVRSKKQRNSSTPHGSNNAACHSTELGGARAA